MDEQADTTPVRFQILGVEPVRGTGRMIALANVAIELAGVELTLQGVQIFRGEGDTLAVRAPQFRHPRDGRWLPAILLPAELRDAIGVVMLRDLAASGAA